MSFLTPQQRQHALELADGDTSIFRPAYVENPKAHARFTCAEIILAIAESGGVVAVAAKRLGCARSTIKNYIARNPAVRRALQMSRRQMCDAAKSRLATEVMGGSLFASIHYLKIYDRGPGHEHFAGYDDDVELVDDL